MDRCLVHQTYELRTMHYAHAVAYIMSKWFRVFYSRTRERGDKNVFFFVVCFIHLQMVMTEMILIFVDVIINLILNNYHFSCLFFVSFMCLWTQQNDHFLFLFVCIAVSIFVIDSVAMPFHPLADVVLLSFFLSFFFFGKTISSTTSKRKIENFVSVAWMKWKDVNDEKQNEKPECIQRDSLRQIFSMLHHHWLN